MSLGSTVCTTTSCSFSYKCDICGHQRLTSEPIPPGQRTAAKWPDKSGYNPRENAADNQGARYILESAAADGDDPVVNLDTAAIDSGMGEPDEDLTRDFTYQVTSHLHGHSQDCAHAGMRERNHAKHQYLSEELD